MPGLLPHSWPSTPGAGASLLCQSGCAGPGQTAPLLINPIRPPKSLPVQPPLPGSPGLLPRVAVVLRGSPAPATQQGGGSPHLQPKHYKQNNPHCHSGTGSGLPSEGARTHTETHRHTERHTHTPLPVCILPHTAAVFPSPWQKAGAWSEGGELVQHMHF